MPSRRALQRSSKPSPALAKNEEMRRFEAVIRLQHDLDRPATSSGDSDSDHQSFSFGSSLDHISIKLVVRKILFICVPVPYHYNATLVLLSLDVW